MYIGFVVLYYKPHISCGKTTFNNRMEKKVKFVGLDEFSTSTGPVGIRQSPLAQLFIFDEFNLSM